MNKLIAQVGLIVLFFMSRSAFAAEPAVEQLPGFQVSQRTAEPLLRSDKPWEDYCIGYCQVMRIGDDWHVWYDAYDHNYKNDSDGHLCYAKSRDGVTWEKPQLGLASHDGSKANNILIERGTHGHCVLYDPDAPADARFKIVYANLVGNGWLVFGGTSPDGIHWTLSDKSLLNHNSDTQQTCFRDGDTYRMYVRMWSGVPEFTGTRIVGYSHSKTFGEFPNPVAILRNDQHDPANLQFYNPGVSKLRDHFYVMLTSGLYTGEDAVRVHLAFSRDGETFERISKDPLMPLGKGFDRMAMYVGPGAIATDKPDEFWFYYVGSDAGHDASSPDKLKNSGGIGRFLLKIKLARD
jgi:predicted GH43/DUF377 family glycosyl hydrolase